MYAQGVREDNFPRLVSNAGRPGVEGSTGKGTKNDLLCNTTTLRVVSQHVITCDSLVIFCTFFITTQTDAEPPYYPWRTCKLLNGANDKGYERRDHEYSGRSKLGRRGTRSTLHFSRPKCGHSLFPCVSQGRLKCSGRAHRTNYFRVFARHLARALHDHARRTRSAGWLPRTRSIFGSFASCFILRLDRVPSISRHESTHTALRVSMHTHQIKDHNKNVDTVQL